VVNYDLPWNPQRNEQRIGCCRRYGQKNDVVAANFVNPCNDADRRVFSLLNDVFGASDDVLRQIDGVDFEKRIWLIYQECRTEDEISTTFEKWHCGPQSEIMTRLDDVKEQVLTGRSHLKCLGEFPYAPLQMQSPYRPLSGLIRRFGSTRPHPALRATLSRRERVLYSLLPSGEGLGMRALRLSWERGRPARFVGFMWADACAPRSTCRSIPAVFRCASRVRFSQKSKCDCPAGIEINLL
jgi:hypothetical protein